MGPDRDITDDSCIQFDRSQELRAWAEVLRLAAHAKETRALLDDEWPVVHSRLR